MTVWSAFTKESSISANRLDGDYFTPANLELEHSLESAGAVELGSICTPFSGRTPSGYTENGEVGVIRSGDLVQPLIYPDGPRVFLRADPTNRSTFLKQGDVLISSIGMGSIGKIGLVYDSDSLVAVAEVTVIRDTPYSPCFLFAFLSSRMGQRQILREVTGATGQQHLIPSNVGKVLIPAPTGHIEDELKVHIDLAHISEVESRKKYRAAEILLENALGLENWFAPTELVNIESFDHIRSSTRLDAEYNSHRSQVLIEALSRNEFTIGSFAELSTRRFKPIEEGVFEYIEISDVTQSGTAQSKSVPVEYAPSRAKWVVEPGDVITSLVRPVRRLSAIVGNDQAESVCSSGFAVLKPIEIEPELLLVYLRLPMVCELLDLRTTSSMYPAITADALLDVPMPRPDDQVAQTIVTLIRESIKLSHKAKQQMRLAIQRVETEYDQ